MRLNICYPVQTDKYDDELAQRILQKEATATSNENEPEIPEYMQHVNYTMNPSVSIDKRVHEFLRSKHLSQDKLLIVNVMLQHFKNVLDGSAKEKAPILFVTGAPGTGKSW